MSILGGGGGVGFLPLIRPIIDWISSFMCRRLTRIYCCREMEEGQRAWAAHRKEAAWRMKRVEMQLETERACRRREAAEEFEAKMRALREEQAAAVERVEAEYREKMAGLRRDAEAKEQKMAEQWAAKHARLAKFLDQVAACRRWPPVEINGGGGGGPGGGR